MTLEFYDKSRILLQSSFFICVRPHPALCQHIASYNITFPTETAVPTGFTVLPSGCATLTITNDGDRLYIDLGGATTKPDFANTIVNIPKMAVSIEFKPAGVFGLTSTNQNELTDIILPLDDITPMLSKSITEAVEKSANVSQLVNNLDNVLIGNMQISHNSNINSMLQNIFDLSGNISVGDLEENFYYSQRQINRIFQQYVGVGPKSFLRMVRINNALRLMKKSHMDQTFISDTMGFYDLSHFIRDFKSVCGVTPQEYRKNMSDFYNNPTRF